MSVRRTISEAHRFYWSSTFLLRSGVFSIFFVAAFHNNSMACIVAEASSSLNPDAQQFVPGVVAMVAHARPLVSLICDWRVLMRTASFSRSRLRSTPRAWRWPWRGPSHRSWLCDRLASVTVGFEERLAGGTWLWLPVVVTHRYPLATPAFQFYFFLVPKDQL